MPYCRTACRLAAIILLGTLVGCQLPARWAKSDPAHSRYERLELEYETVGAADVSQLRTRARLRLEYPHPEGSGDEARAILRISNHSGEASAPDDELWTLDLPREELDQLLIALADEGVFREGNPTVGPANLALRWDRQLVEKRQPSSPALESLIARTEREGCLTGFVPANEPIALAAATTSRRSVAPHRN